jgi:hypothetical protein
MATLKHAWRTNLDVEGLVVRSDEPPVWEPRTTVHIPLSGSPLVSSLPGLTRTGTLTVWCPDRAARDRVLALAWHGGPLRLDDVCDPDLLDAQWIAVTSVDADRPNMTSPGLWLSLSYTRVAPPTEAPPVPWTYGDLAVELAAYTDLPPMFATYDALWLGPAGLPTDPAPDVAGWPA